MLVVSLRFCTLKKKESLAAILMGFDFCIVLFVGTCSWISSRHF